MNSPSWIFDDKQTRLGRIHSFSFSSFYLLTHCITKEEHSHIICLSCRSFFFFFFCYFLFSSHYRSFRHTHTHTHILASIRINSVYCILLLSSVEKRSCSWDTSVDFSRWIGTLDCLERGKTGHEPSIHFHVILSELHVAGVAVVVFLSPEWLVERRQSLSSGFPVTWPSRRADDCCCSFLFQPCLSISLLSNKCPRYSVPIGLIEETRTRPARVAMLDAWRTKNWARKPNWSSDKLHHPSTTIDRRVSTCSPRGHQQDTSSKSALAQRWHDRRRSILLVILPFL